jgi:septal ring factor EnvC (AmiA/AmiB activator)
VKDKKKNWARKVINWTQSEEGKRQIEEADKNAQKAIDEFRKRIRNVQLHRQHTQDMLIEIDKKISVLSAWIENSEKNR